MSGASIVSISMDTAATQRLIGNASSEASRWGQEQTTVRIGKRVVNSKRRPRDGEDKEEMKKKHRHRFKYEKNKAYVSLLGYSLVAVMTCKCGKEKP
jgi:hypothetical protein